ncbi:MAG: regulatory protein RecX [Planctomycetota bacterium]
MTRGRRAADVPDPAEVCPVDAGLSVERVGLYRGDESRLAITVGGKHVAVIGVTDADVVSVGMAWDATLAADVWLAAKTLAATRHALRLLGARDRSRSRLRLLLVQRGHERQAVDRAMGRLVDRGLIDDASLAERRSSTLAARGQHGKRGIEMKLRSMGIGTDTARAAAGEATEGVDERSSAVELAAKRASRFSDALPYDKARRRLYGFLVRRGFSHDDAAHAVERALADRPGDARPEDPA